MFDSYFYFIVLFRAFVLWKMKLTCKSRVFISTCLLVWSFSSLLITNRLMKTGQDTTGDTVIDMIQTVNKSRQIVRGQNDFHGELIDMPDIDDEGADNFDPEPTEMNMEVGLGRHD